MRKPIEVVTALLLRMMWVVVRPSRGRPRDERGDVPGWVMITVMSAAIVVALLGIARPQLGQMLQNALKSVQ